MTTLTSLPYTRGVRQKATLVAAETKRSVLDLIRASDHPGITKIEIATKLQRDVKTIDRALGALIEDGAQFSEAKSPHGGPKRYTLKRPPSWDTKISHAAQLLLALIQPSLGSEQVRLLEDLVASNMTQRDKDLAAILKANLLVHGGQADPMEPEDSILQEILHAWVSKKGVPLLSPRMVQLSYITGEGKMEEGVEVMPYKLVHDVFTGGAYLLGWAPARNAVRTYHLGRIREVVVLDRPAIITEEHEQKLARVAANQIGAFGNDDEPEEAVVKVTAPGLVQGLLDNPPALPDFQITPGKGKKTATLRFNFNDPRGAVRWISQWGLSVEVMAPASLRKAMADESVAMAARYTASTTS